jgi:hypothetical protein
VYSEGLWHEYNDSRYRDCMYLIRCSSGTQKSNNRTLTKKNLFLLFHYSRLIISCFDKLNSLYILLLARGVQSPDSCVTHQSHEALMTEAQTASVTLQMVVLEHLFIFSRSESFKPYT